MLWLHVGARLPGLLVQQCQGSYYYMACCFVWLRAALLNAARSVSYSFAISGCSEWSAHTSRHVSSGHSTQQGWGRQRETRHTAHGPSD